MLCRTFHIWTVAHPSESSCATSYSTPGQNACHKCRIRMAFHPYGSPYVFLALAYCHRLRDNASKKTVWVCEISCGLVGEIRRRILSCTGYKDAAIAVWFPWLVAKLLLAVFWLGAMLHRSLGADPVSSVWPSFLWVSSAGLRSALRQVWVGLLEWSI